MSRPRNCIARMDSKTDGAVDSEAYSFGMARTRVDYSDFCLTRRSRIEILLLLLLLVLLLLLLLVLVLEWMPMSEPIFDHEKLDACIFEIARGSVRKTQLRRIVSMPTRLIQRSGRMAQDAIEYEYEYRDAEYESRA